MWDEEGLDPLGGLTTTPGSNTTHHIGSFDSDLNSVVSSVTCPPTAASPLAPSSVGLENCTHFLTR